MNVGILRLKFLYLDEYDIAPKCELCKKDYKLVRKFYKRERTKTGGYLFHFASPEKGFAEGEEIFVPKKDLLVYGIGPDLTVQTPQQTVKLYRRVFDDPDDPDVRIRWRRLRAFLTKKYKHPEPEGDNPCSNATGEGKERYRTEGPPQTIFQWAKPLFVALYALGLSYREILSANLLPLGEHPEVHQSVRRQVDKYLEEAEDSVREELVTLHKENRRKYQCQWEYAKDTYGMVWEVSIHTKQGETNPQIVRWLGKFAEQHKKYLEFIPTRNVPIDPIERLTTQPLPHF
jgi:hypothetical protein